MKKFSFVPLVLSAVIVLSACSAPSKPEDQATQPGQVTENAEGETEAEVQPEVKEEVSFPQLEEKKKGSPTATIKTDKGDVKVILYPEYAPKAVENFTTHAKDGYYDGLTFHRVINDFMVQTGDPSGDGTGGESIWGEVFENEVSVSLRNFRGALAMANSGENTNGSQFYIVQNKSIGEEYTTELKDYIENQDAPVSENEDGTITKMSDLFPTEVCQEYIDNGGYPSLDFSYTVFGQVYEGMDVIDAIAAVETDSNDKPVEDVIVKSIKIGTY